MITVNMHFDSLQEAAQAFAAFAQYQGVVTPLPTAAPVKAVKPAKPELVAEPKLDTAAAPAVEVAADPKPVAAKPADTPTASETVGSSPIHPADAVDEPAAASPSEAVREYSEVAKVVTAVSKLKGRPFAVELLGKFGASSLPSAEPEQFDAIFAAFDAVLSA